ncbi:MAG: hypothetical protein ACK5LR_07560 [Mangrovibacterium sp.]
MTDDRCRMTDVGWQMTENPISDNPIIQQSNNPISNNPISNNPNK